MVLFGVDATAYPMQDGSMSTGLIAAVPLEYITDFLSLEDEE
ncbi:sensory box histidine kinase/response regulator [Intestinimonas butyriciproducens]|nr:sensory box histidine kinase/response regulator [Intestinimonas butyriciproducens]